MSGNINMNTGRYSLQRKHEPSSLGVRCISPPGHLPLVLVGAFCLMKAPLDDMSNLYQYLSFARLP